jgi:hypothetical protein
VLLLVCWVLFLDDKEQKQATSKATIMLPVKATVKVVVLKALASTTRPLPLSLIYHRRLWNNGTTRSPKTEQTTP